MLMDKKLNKALKTTIFAALIATFVATPAFAEGIADCTGYGQKYSGLNAQESATSDYPVKCQRIKTGSTYTQFYGRSSADCSQLSSLTANPEQCEAAKATTETKEEKTDNNTEKAKEKTDDKEIILISLIALNDVLLVVIAILIAILINKTKKHNKPIEQPKPEKPIQDIDNIYPTPQA